jgi:hypothetical protein
MWIALCGPHNGVPISRHALTNSGHTIVSRCIHPIRFLHMRCNAMQEGKSLHILPLNAGKRETIRPRSLLMFLLFLLSSLTLLCSSISRFSILQTCWSFCLFPLKSRHRLVSDRAIFLPFPSPGNLTAATSAFLLGSVEGVGGPCLKQSKKHRHCLVRAN